jgi:sugar (pentulose or hexulose) kinase
MTALGLDLGTSGARAAVLDASGEVLAMARAAYGSGPEAGRDPERWWDAASACIRDVLAALREAGHDPAALTGLAVDGTSGSVVLTDAALRPVTRALMYDAGGFEAEAATIARHAPDRHVARGPGSALARALRLVAEDPGGRARHLLHQADFVSARLTGRGGHTDVNNALKTGIDPATGAWPAWIGALPLPRGLLPRAHAPGEPLDRIAPAVARALGLPPALRVHAGTTDSIAAFLAAAPPEPGRAVTSLGTTLAVKLMSTARVDRPELGLYSHRLGGGWLVGGASNTGGGVLRALFAEGEVARLSALIDPDAVSPFDYYPLPRPGERFPVDDPTLAPRMTPRPADDAAFLHGLLEGMARIERRAYEAMAAHGATTPRRIVTAGGGAANEAWTRIRARVLGLPVSAAPTPEAAVGAARLALGASAGR